MKLWHSFLKELKLASRGYYFYIEIAMAFILLAVLLFVIPENFSNKTTEYLYFDLPEGVVTIYEGAIIKDDIDGKVENVEVKSKKELIPAKFYETEERKIYIVESEAEAKQLSETEKKLGAVISLDDSGKMHYKYFLQGYESQRLKNLYSVIHNRDMDELEKELGNVVVRSLSSDYEVLSDRENVIPSFLTFNGSLMGLFIIAAYIFLDKQEGVIKAYAVTASSVWEYLLSKVGVLLVTTIFSSLLIVIPVMGLQPNYPLLLILLITSGFFASSLGLLLATFFKNLIQAFGAVYVIMIVMLLPNIAYFIPGWDPAWIKVIPAYPLIQGFKESILTNGDVSYILSVSLGFLVVGMIIFYIANVRYKKDLTI